MDAMSASDMMTMLQNVDQFYERSWNHLLVMGSVALAVVGIGMPLLIQWLQARTFAKETASLEKRIEDAAGSLEKRLAGDRADLEGGVRKLEAELRKEIARAQGSAFHVQTLLMISDKAYGAAFHSAVNGLEQYREGDEHSNTLAMLRLITKCLPHMTKAELDGMEDARQEFDCVMASIKAWDTKGDFLSAMGDVKKAFMAASERDSV